MLLYVWLSGDGLCDEYRHQFLDKPSVSFCTHYNRTDCERAKKTKNPAEEKKYCEPRTKSCTVNTDANFCFNIWVERDEPKTNSTTDIEVM